jgi:hypothetical protein
VTIQSASIRVRIEAPNFPVQKFDWLDTVYGNVKEEIAKDTPEPLGEPVVLLSNVDANLYHNMLIGCSVTGTLHFCNQTLVDWFSKWQAFVQTARFGSKFVAFQISADQIVDLRSTLL